MNSYPYPDFSEHGYQLVRELGRNREGGRITWLASNIETEKQVVLKQFCFAQAGSSWSGFEAHQREIRILQGLAHPGIPRYINSFVTSDGFCLVQEYINAQSLAERLGDFDIEEIKQIAFKALDILEYLQLFNPPVIHRDIKPENMLVDEELNVYLIDFGFARIESQEVAGSSVFKGTPGFMPPEQMFEPTKATDLYALGTTLICLLTKIRSTEIRQLCDRKNPYQIHFQNHLPRLSLSFLGWLHKMVQPLQDDRFPNGKAALAALQPIDVIREAAVELSAAVLEFKATHLGEKLTQTITVANPMPDTVLEGKWQVSPHPHDPPHTPDSHAWISVEKPIRCTQEAINCRICVDTSKLMADAQYKRQLILHSNAYPSTHTVTVKVQTAAIPIEKRKLPYAGLIWLFLIAEMIAMATAWFTSYAAAEVASWLLANSTYNSVVFNFRICIFLMAVNIVSSLISINRMYPLFKYREFLEDLPVKPLLGFAHNNSTMGSTVASSVSRIVDMAVGVAVGTAVGVAVGTAVGLAVGLAVDLAVFWAVGLAVSWTTYKVLLWAINLAEDLFTSVLLLLIAGLGASVGISLIIGFLNPLIFLSLSATGLPVLYMIFYPQIKRRKLMAKYRHSEDLLIRP
jgi:serine/threonine protein kinase